MISAWGIRLGVRSKLDTQTDALCCPLVPEVGSAAGFEEGSPRFSASLRTGDSLPRPTTSIDVSGRQQQRKSVGDERAAQSKVDREDDKAPIQVREQESQR